MSEVPSLTVSEHGGASVDKTGASEHPEYQNAVTKIQRGLDARCEQARQNPKYSAAERGDSIRQHWRQATEAYAELRTYYEGQLEADVMERENDLFQATVHSPADVRGAYEMVYSATKGFDSGKKEGMEEAQKELERYAERARRTGDRGLQHAVGHIAIERGIADIRDSYISASKERTRAWEAYTGARRKQDSFKSYRMHVAAGMGGLVMPPEAR